MRLIWCQLLCFGYLFAGFFLGCRYGYDRAMSLFGPDVNVDLHEASASVLALPHFTIPIFQLTLAFAALCLVALRTPPPPPPS